jgi:hypothetical protein
MSFVSSVRRQRGKSRGAGAVFSAVQEMMESRLLFSAILWQENFNGLNFGPNQEETTQGDEVWTKTPPAGWLKEDSGVPGYNNPDLPAPEADNNGKTEWIGFTFAKKDWWIEAAGDQDRSAFTRASGGVMIADPDEWDDEDHPGKTAGWATEADLYNAHITTASIPLAGAKPGTLNIEFDSAWRPEGFDDGAGINNQTAIVEAVYNTGGTQELIHWDSDGPPPPERPRGTFYHEDKTFENEHVSVPLIVPAGATSVRLKFTMAHSANDWYWAVDNLSLTGDPDVQNVKLIGVSSSDGTAAQNESLYDITYTLGATPSASATKIVGVASVPDNDAIAFGPATGLLYHASGGTSLSDTPSDPHYRDNHYLETVDVTSGTNARAAVYNANSPQFGLTGPMPSFVLPATRRTDAQIDPQFGESAKGPNEYRGIRDFTWSSADNAFFVSSEEGIYKVTAAGQSTFLSDPQLGAGGTAGLGMINLNGQMQLLAGTFGGSDLWLIDPVTGQSVTGGQIFLTDPAGAAVGGVLSIVQSPDGNTLLALVKDFNDPDDPLKRRLAQLDIHLDPENGNTATATTIGTFTAPINDLAFVYQAGAAPTPHVTKVFVNGPNLTANTTQNAAWRGAAGADLTFGYPIPDGANQLRPIPWNAGVNKVSIQFDQEVSSSLDQADLQVRGSGGVIATTAYSYDAPTKTGTWTLGSTVAVDKLRFVLSAAGVTGLDGEWVNPATATPAGDTYPSGDGSVGGDFNFRVNVLRGDANGDQQVNALDVADVKKRLLRRPGDGVTGSNAYSIFADLNTDGVVNALDVAGVKGRLNTRINNLPDPASALLLE